MLVDRRVQGHGVLKASILWNIWWSSCRYPKCVPLEGEAKIARNDDLVREDFEVLCGNIIRKVTSVWQVMKAWPSMARVMDVAPPCHHLISQEIEPHPSQ